MYHIHMLMLMGARLAIRLSHDTTHRYLCDGDRRNVGHKKSSFLLTVAAHTVSSFFARRPSLGSITVGLRVQEGQCFPSESDELAPKVVPLFSICTLTLTVCARARGLALSVRVGKLLGRERNGQIGV